MAPMSGLARDDGGVHHGPPTSDSDRPRHARTHLNARPDRHVHIIHAPATGQLLCEPPSTQHGRKPTGKSCCERKARGEPVEPSLQAVTQLLMSVDG
jgi:hypothetical protein